MNVLFLCQRVPYPPNKGDKLRAYHELLALAERGHAIHLLAFADNPADEENIQKLRELCASVRTVALRPRQASLRGLAGVVGRAPLSLEYFRSGSMRRAVLRCVDERRPAALLVCSSVMAQYLPSRLHKCTVVDLVDVDSEKWRVYAQRSAGARALVYALEAQRLRRYEQWLISHVASVVVSAEREAVLLKDASGTPPNTLHVVSNGVDVDYFCPYPQPPADATAKLLFTGVMNYFPNVDGVRYFADEGLPLVMRERPETELLVVGRNPSRQVRQLHGRAGVRIVGEVADVRPYFRQATASVLPLRIARGVQNKLLEAMACARAVVATPQVAAGLAVVASQHLLVAETAPDLAQAVLRLLADHDLRARLGQQARRFVEREHQWAPVMRSLTDLVEAVAA